MAFPRFILVSLFLLIFLSESSVSVSGSRELLGISMPKVSLGLYYETLCPYCSNFIVNYLAKIFKNGLIDIVDLNLVPYGNARIANGTISCQHGPYECLLNAVEGCAIHVWPELDKHFSFIYCVESLVVERKYGEWQTCFDKVGLDSKPVVDCYNEGQGKKLQLQYANETNKLEPPHQYVPWVVVDGRPLYEDYEEFETNICKAYKGKPPKACKNLPLAVISDKKDNVLNGVCYPGERLQSSSTSMRRQMEIQLAVHK